MGALEVFSGLYKHAAILHFPVSAFPAKSVSVACGGSGRGLPADARLQFFPRLFPFQSIFFLLSRTRVDGLAVLTRVGFNIQTIGTTQFLSFLNASRNEDCCCVWTGRGMLLLPPQLASERASPSLSRHILGICQPPPNGNITVLPTTLVDSLIARGLCSAL